jgi:Sulfotransferase domain
MLVWVASFPRSGNTYLRILLNRRYGIRTSVIYDVDGVAERLGADIIGAIARPASLTSMRDCPELHFIKTHRQRDDDVHRADRAICLVRDGRDALVSWARLASEDDPSRFETQLHEMITRTARVGTGSWGRNVLSWLRPPAPQRIVLTYDELTTAPEAALQRIMLVVAPQLPRRSGDRLPDFGDLRAVDGGFFRRGASGSHRDEMPAHLHDLFWAQPDNVDAMRLLGW